MDEMAAFESVGQGMMGEQLRNERGATIPGWMINGQLCYPFTDTYEPTPDEMIPAIAERRGQSALEVMWDLLMDVDGPSAGVLWRPLIEYQGHNDNIVAGLGMPNIIPGFDDAGAHCTILTDATCATTNLHYYGRDRVAGNGKTVPMETIIKTQTMDAAHIFGLEDRGVLKPGLRADINIIDMAKLKVGKPYWVNDLPTDAGRWLQHTQGYRATVLRGVVTFEHDQHTGTHASKINRNAHSSKSMIVERLCIA